MGSSMSKVILVRRFYARVFLIIIPFIGFWISMYFLVSDLKSIRWANAKNLLARSS